MDKKNSYLDYKKMKEITQNEKNFIPKGVYCYGLIVNSKYKDTEYSKDIDFFDYYDKVICPFWKDIGDGWVKCNHLKISSNSEKGHLFWDLVKECKCLDFEESDISINDDDFELISDNKLEMMNSVRE